MKIIADPQVFIPDEHTEIKVISPKRETKALVDARRDVVAGFARGWGMQFGGRLTEITSSELFQSALKVARLKGHESLLSDIRLANIFEILLTLRSDGQLADVVEFGSYNCGTVFFCAVILKSLSPKSKIIAFDTFEGIPSSNNFLDGHSERDFSSKPLEQIKEMGRGLGLENIEFVMGDFKETFIPWAISRPEASVSFIHADCDVYSSVKFVCDNIWSATAPGAYLVFDDANTSSCISATEAVEKMIQNKKIHSEQAWPHLVFRVEERHRNSAPLDKRAMKSTIIRQCRGFNADAVDKKLLHALLQEAHECPSVGNSKPWRLVSLETSEARSRLKQIFDDSLASTLDTMSEEYRDKYLKKKPDYFTSASVQIAVFTEHDLKLGHKQGWATFENALEHSTVGMLSELRKLVIEAGLGLAWVSTLDPETMRKEFAKSASWTFTAHIAIGVPADKQTSSKNASCSLTQAGSLELFTQ